MAFRTGSDNLLAPFIAAFVRAICDRQHKVKCLFDKSCIDLLQLVIPTIYGCS